MSIIRPTLRTVGHTRSLVPLQLPATGRGAVPGGTSWSYVSPVIATAPDGTTWTIPPFKPALVWNTDAAHSTSAALDLAHHASVIWCFMRGTQLYATRQQDWASLTPGADVCLLAWVDVHHDLVPRNAGAGGTSGVDRTTAGVIDTLSPLPDPVSPISGAGPGLIFSDGTNINYWGRLHPLYDGTTGVFHGVSTLLGFFLPALPVYYPDGTMGHVDGSALLPGTPVGGTYTLYAYRDSGGADQLGFVVPPTAETSCAIFTLVVQGRLSSQWQQPGNYLHRWYFTAAMNIVSPFILDAGTAALFGPAGSTYTAQGTPIQIADGQDFTAQYPGNLLVLQTDDIPPQTLSGSWSDPLWFGFINLGINGTSSPWNMTRFFDPGSLSFSNGLQTPAPGSPAFGMANPPDFAGFVAGPRISGVWHFGSAGIAGLDYCTLRTLPDPWSRSGAGTSTARVATSAPVIPVWSDGTVDPTWPLGTPARSVYDGGTVVDGRSFAWIILAVKGVLGPFLVKEQDFPNSAALLSAAGYSSPTWAPLARLDGDSLSKIPQV